MRNRTRTIERDIDGWIARNPFTGEVILGDDFRWNNRESARCAVWEARHLSPEAQTYRQLLRLADGVKASHDVDSMMRLEHRLQTGKWPLGVPETAGSKP